MVDSRGAFRITLFRGLLYADELVGLQAEAPMGMLKDEAHSGGGDSPVLFVIAGVAGLQAPHLRGKHLLVGAHVLAFEHDLQLMGLQHDGLVEHLGRTRDPVDGRGEQSRAVGLNLHVESCFVKRVDERREVGL